MQSNIFELIDLLVKMSGSNSNLDELKADLEDTTSRIGKVEKKLELLEADMNDEKYFDATSEIVDRNIQISLNKKIQNLIRVKSDINKELEGYKEEEKELHDKLEEITQEIKDANSYNDIINNNVSSNEAYNNMIASENDRITNLVNEKEELESKYSTVQKKVEYLAASLIEIEEKIENEQARLKDIENNLSNIKSYVDIEAKEEDELRYASIKNELEELLNHKEEILNDTVYIAGLIKEGIANEKQDEVEEEFKHLVDIVEQIPFMNLQNSELEQVKQKLDEELKNYDEEISKKEYQTMDREFIEERIKYLEDETTSTEDSKKLYNGIVKELTSKNDDLSRKIYNAETQISKINKSLKDYDNYDYDSSEIAKSVIQASNNKLVEEKTNIESIVKNYRSDLVSNIELLNDFKSKLSTLDELSKNIDNELDDLNKKLALSTKSTNILEEEKDKIKLEKINNSIMDLKNRETFNKSISEILDEFEMLLSSLEFADKKTRNKVIFEEEKEEPIVIEKEPEINEVPIIADEIDAPISIDEVIENANKDKEEVIAPVIEEAAKEEKEEIPFIPFVEEEIKEEEPKLRVVEIIPISDGITENSDKDYMVNDFQDDDYVDFETAISSAEGK
ncbi:MAG: hypothetical protein K6G37_00845 [Bacilli bacterium]|nr:hypothetical protein [Bacilli bacterium]